MNKLKISKKAVQMFSHVSMLLIVLTALVTASVAQTVPAGGDVITNQASATYSDGTNNFETVSNTVTVTVANVSGLAITPDAGTRSSVVPGQTAVLYSFTVTNTGNFADQVQFLANGASLQLTGAGTITRAVIDSGATAGAIDATDTNIFTNSANVFSASINRNNSITVLVEVSVNASAAPGSTINIQLGDATNGTTYDNQAIPTGTAASAHEVRTVATTSVNGLREARGDVSATVENDAQLRLSVTYPSGPLAQNSDITYGWQLCNTGLRAAQNITLGGTNGVFIVAPVPVGTTLKSGQTFPAGTLYTGDNLTTAPTAATWTTTAPATVTRVAFNVGASLAAAAAVNSPTCTTQGGYDMIVTITATDATNDIFQIGDAFARNSLDVQITDQSNDSVSNVGDGNANFNESKPANQGNAAVTISGTGLQVVTTRSRTGSVLIGPATAPDATGPNSNNDDYTNRSVTTGINVAPFDANGNVNITNAGGTITFTNTVRNTGNANDTFTISRQSAPAGFTVEVCTNQLLANCAAADWTTLTTNTVSLPINFATNADIHVRVTAPSGQSVLTGYDTVIRAASTLTASATNDTIDRFYTGALRLTKTATVNNTTNVGGATDAVSGAEITYVITYENITSTGGTGSLGLTLSNIVITEDGSAAPNNWGATTTHVSHSDANGRIVLSNADTKLVDTVTTLAPTASGTFTFIRKIN